MVEVLLFVLAAVVVVAQLTSNSAEPTWERLAAEYDTLDYRSLAISVKVAQEELPNQITVNFKSELNDTVSGRLILPPNSDGPVAVVLLLHGLSGSRDDIIGAFGSEILNRGMALFALDLPLHGQRSRSGTDIHDNLNIRRAMYFGVRDWLIATEWLRLNAMIDDTRITLLGYSLGSMIGVIVGALHPAISALALCVGGDAVMPRASRLPRRLRTLAWPIAPSLFASHLAPRPVLMLNGREDDVVLPAHAQLLWDNLGEPREIRWYDCGHRLPDDAGQFAVEWLHQQVTPGAQSNSQQPTDSLNSL